MSLKEVLERAKLTGEEREAFGLHSRTDLQRKGVAQAATAKAVSHVSWGIVEGMEENLKEMAWLGVARAGYEMAINDLVQSIVPLNIPKPEVPDATE